jgi:hypothetical protein
MPQITPSSFSSQRELATKTGDGLDMVINTGYVLFSLQGRSGAWNRATLVFNVGPYWASRRGTTVTVSPSSMYNKDVATNAGWAVDDVATSWSTNQQVKLYCYLAVSDSDGYLYRVNYHVTSIGRLTSGAAVNLDFSDEAEVPSEIGGRTY